MGTYGISAEELLEGHVHITRNKETNYYGFEEFLRDFGGDVCADTIVDAWNILAKKHGWYDRIKVIKK